MATSAPSFSNNSKVRFMQQRFRQIADLTAEKVARHLESPGQYPLPANKKSLEHALHDVVQAAGNIRKKRFRDHMKDALSATAAERQQRYGDLASLDLKKNKPVADMVKALAINDNMKFTAEEIKRLRSVMKIPVHKRAKAAVKTPRQAAVATVLDFFVDSITCEKTNDLRKDEVSISGFASDAAGVESERAAFFAGEFKKGESIALGNNSLFFNFAIDAGSVGGDFPLTFIAGVILTEADLIKNKDLARKLTILFSVLFLVFVTAATAVLFVPAVPIIVAEIGFIAASVSGILGHYVFPLLADDFSDPVFDTLVLEAPPAIGDTFTRTLDVPIGVSILGFDKGKYKANVRWVAS